MHDHDDIDDTRRRVLIRMLAAGAFAGPGLPALAEGLFGSVPEKLAPGQSIYRLEGTVEVNGKSATMSTQIGPGDTVKTGARSTAIFVVGGHSMILRSDSHLTMEAEPQNPIIQVLRLITGKILSVSRDSRYTVRTPTATIGIRGTGIYAEADAEQTYFCTCYGTTDISASKDAASRESVVSQHHDKPLYILGGEPPGKNIRSAPFINHTDQELMLIEALVGRTPPFVFPDDKYSSPRRRY
ncbi:MAG: FecR domain-containing protein [Burkholderiaceae bacterium]|nr:FecR domain-containing protein [Burkholderiaceae bacterium]